MVAFTGNVPTPGLGKDSFQEAYIEGITMPITKHNFTVRKVEAVSYTHLIACGNRVPPQRTVLGETPDTPVQTPCVTPVSCTE